MVIYSGDMRSAPTLLASVVLLAGALLQPCGAAQSGEVRIRSAPYHPPSATITVDTSLVELGVTVRDRKGTPVGGLQAFDFIVFDNLKPQNITFFSEQRLDPPGIPGATISPNAPSSAALPIGSPAAQLRYIALFFDDTHAGLAGFERSRRAAEKLIADGLQPGDRIAIFAGSGAVALEFTGDTKVLLATLANMRRHPDRSVISGFGACPTLTAYQAYMIAKHLDPMAKAVAVADIRACDPPIPEDVAEMQAQSAAETAWDQLRHQSSNVLDALMLVVRHLAAAPGARILLMVSPGFVTGDMERQTDAFNDTCLREHIVVNALDEEGLLAKGPEEPESLGRPSGPRAGWADRTLALRTQIVTTFMGEAAAATGGKFIHNSNDLAGGLRALTSAPEVSYLLGFSPPDKPNGKYHKLKVTLAKSSGYEVSARPGYFSTVRTEQPKTAQQRIDRVVASGELLDRVPATVKVYAVAGNDGRHRIQVDITLDAKRLPFSALNGASVQQLTFVTVLEDAAGNYMQGKQAVMDLVLTNATRAQLEEKGLKAATSFLVAEGNYRIREVIREAIHNQLTASESPIEIR
jgi:VWFA-related protein